MKLADLANDIKTHVESGNAWLVKVLDESMPGFLAEAEKYQSNPIVQAIEGLVLPPQVEQEIVNLIKAFVSVLPAQPAAGPAAEPAAEPVAGQPAA